MDGKNYLEHVGVLGMKWGRRKAHITTHAKPTHTTSGENSEDFIKSRQLKKKAVSEMSNKELQDYVNRMNLEKQYKQIKSSDISPGRKFVQDLLVDVGKDLVKTTVKNAMKDPDSIKKMFNSTSKAAKKVI